MICDETLWISRSAAAWRPCARLARGPNDEARHRDFESILYHYGPSELLSRLSDPFWFQALGAVMGMDWHSSGITTSVHGRLEARTQSACRMSSAFMFAEGAANTRAKHLLNCAPLLIAIGLDGDALVRTSRLTARVDNNAIADGFQLYLHSFIVTQKGNGPWCNKA